MFDHFRKCNYDAVLEAQQKFHDQADKNEFDEDNDGLARQKQMVEVLVEYYKDGCKDPKKAYSALSEIENEDKQEPF
jgi:hypothetical protein